MKAIKKLNQRRSKVYNFLKSIVDERLVLILKAVARVILYVNIFLLGMATRTAIILNNLVW